jgi:phospholipase/carboxylesterase
MLNHSSDLLDTVEINPNITPTASVIWLHGLGADGNDFVPIVPELNLPKNFPIRFVFPHAPMQAVTINNGYIMRSWYDIVSLEINHHADQKGITASTEKLIQLIEHEESLGIPSERIILAGFSQGAVIALTTGLTFQKRLAGIIALSGYLPHTENVMKQASPLNQSIPIFLAHGTNDAVVPFFLGQSAYAELMQRHYSVSWHTYAMPHSVCMEEIRDIGQWIMTVIT